MQKISASTSLANASGEYSEGNPVGGQPATPIKAAWLNSVQRELAAAIALAGFEPDPAKDNQLAMTITNVARNGAANYALDKGSANAYKAAFTPAVDSLVDGLVLRFIAKNATSGASTFVADGLPVKPLLNPRYKPMEAGQIAIGSLCWVQFVAALDSWVLLLQMGNAVPTTIAGYAITDAYTKAQIDVLIGAQTKVVVTPTVAGSASTTAGTAITLTASSTSLLTGGSIASFTWTLPDGTSSTTAATSNSASKSVTAQGSIGSTFNVKVMATDNAGNTSQVATKPISITNHVAPTAPATITVASAVYQGSTGNQLSATGSTASDGASLTYSLSQSGPVALTFSKTNNIAGNEVVTFAAPAVAADTPVTVNVVAVDSFGAVSPSKSAVVTISAIPSQPGMPYAGGFYVGSMRYPDGLYALIDAGKSAEASLPWNDGGSATYIITYVTDLLDGKKNTDILVSGPNSGYYLSKAAKYCRDYAGGGYTDWYLPAYYERELCYRNGKPTAENNATVSDFNGSNPSSQPAGAAYTAANPAQTSVSIYRSGGAQAFDPVPYWTSTGNRSSAYSDGAYFQSFQNGMIYIQNAIANALRVRPMRKVKIGN